MRKKIFIIGSYWAWNIWDETILQVITKKFQDINWWKDFEIIPAIPHLPYRFFSIPFRLKSLWNLWKSDLVLLWWWGLFTDSDSIKAIKIWWKNIFWAKLFWKKIFLFANSIWPFHQKKSQELTKKYFKKIDYFSVRDKISFLELEKMWFVKKWDEEKIIFSDPVFSYKILEKILEKKYLNKKIIAVSLRKLNNWKFNFQEFEKFLEEKEKNWYQILFVAMEDWDSILFEDKFKIHNNSKINQNQIFWRIIFKPKNFSELLEVLSEVEFCIWMRLHFLIASAILWKKMLAISYSQKVKWIMEKIWINFLDIDKKNFLWIEKFFKVPEKILEEKEKFSELINKVREILK
jgi:polysaccharide pyruvyl transferase WcaK-like protein